MSDTFRSRIPTLSETVLAAFAFWLIATRHPLGAGPNLGAEQPPDSIEIEGISSQPHPTIRHYLDGIPCSETRGPRPSQREQARPASA